jgi:hypothetical protein
MANKALDKLPEVLKANAAAKEEAQTKRVERFKAAVESLKGNAEVNQGVADSKANQAAADKFAADVVKSVMGGIELTADWAAQLFDVYKDSTKHPKGSPAFLKALGLSS